MAQRDLSDYQTVTQVVAPQTAYEGPSETSQLLRAGAEIGQKIISANNASKITRNFSDAQVDLASLQNDYQINMQSDPFGAAAKFKNDSKKVLDKYGADIDPFFKQDWQDQSQKLSTKNNLEMQTWAYGQTKKNTVLNINTAIKNNLNQAASDGQAYGNNGEADDGEGISNALINFAQSKQQLINFGDTHLGSEDTTALLENHDADYMKSFVSGVADANPLKALRMMDDPKVQASFKNPQQYLEMKKAVENRSMHVNEVNTQNEVLSVLKNENNVLTQSLKSPMSYADLQQALTSQKMSPEASEYFMKINGYGGGEKKPDEATQIQDKAQLYQDILDAGKQPLDATKISDLQAKVYKAANNGTLEKNEVPRYLDQLVSPLITRQEEALKGFSSSTIGQTFAPKIFGDPVGLAGLQTVFDKQIAVPAVTGTAKGGKLTAEESNAQDRVNLMNDTKKVKLYDYYMDALQATAAGYSDDAHPNGLLIGDVAKLNGKQQRQIFAQAQNQAINLYMKDEHPILSTLTDTPNQIMQAGKLIQGTAGDRNLKPDAAAPALFETYSGSDGFLYRKYPNGKFERVGKDPR